MSTSNPAPKTKWALLLVNGVLVTGIAAAIIWGLSTYFNLDHDLYTNDAQVEEYINPINTRIPGYIQEVRFSDHQPVKKGDTLVIIDNREYKIQLAQAQASALYAQSSKNVTASSVNTAHNNLSVSDANIDAAKARLWNAEQNYHRFENLFKDGAATQQQLDQVKTEYTALQAQTAALVQQRLTASLLTTETAKRVNVGEAEEKRAGAAVDLARLNLSYTVITAPYDGVTGRRNIQEGQLVQAGQTLLSFIRNNSKWVVANYPETQVTQLRIGDKMSLTIDGLKNKTFIGKVTAISQATGSRYSAIPVDNSAGNFVKVQQRVPVRIEFSEDNNKPADLNLLIAGMNVEVKSLEAR